MDETWTDRSEELTPSLEKLNFVTPLPLLGVAGVTNEDRLAARKLRLKRWSGQSQEWLDAPLDFAFEAEPSVALFSATAPRDVGEAADTALSGLPSGNIAPKDWNEIFQELPSAICGILEPWAEAAVRTIAREDLGESILAGVADFFEEREARIDTAYQAANKRPLVGETPWDRWDVRRSIFDHVVMLAVCGGRRLPAIVGSVEAARLIWELQPLFPEASRADFADAMLHAVRFGVGHFRHLHEGVVELPGVGFEVAYDHRGKIVAASPGRVHVRQVRGGCAIELWLRGWEARVAELPNRAWITEKTLFERLTWAGAPVSQKVVAECLRAGLMDRIRTAAAGGGCHGD